MNKKEHYTVTHPEQQSTNPDEPDMLHINNTELLHSIGMTPTRKMRISAAAKTSMLNIGATMCKVIRLRHTSSRTWRGSWLSH